MVPAGMLLFFSEFQRGLCSEYRQFPELGLMEVITSNTVTISIMPNHPDMAVWVFFFLFFFFFFFFCLPPCQKTCVSCCGCWQTFFLVIILEQEKHQLHQSADFCRRQWQFWTHASVRLDFLACQTIYISYMWTMCCGAELKFETSPVYFSISLCVACSNKTAM